MTASDQELPPAAPDWDTQKEDLKCPLCDYNLRGLSEPRCPECGFKFTWQELFDAQRNRHNYLFEDHPKRNLWSFWKTFWNDCRPQQFWQELSPAHVVRIKRLLIYWLLANGILVMPLITPLIKNGIAIMRQNARMSQAFTLTPGGTSYQYRIRGINGIPRYQQISVAQYQQLVIPVRSWNFVQALWNRTFLYSSFSPSIVEILLWPWLTLLSLLIFQASMRKAKIKSSHVVRCAVYGCDFTLLAVAVFMIISFLSDRPNDSTQFILLMIFPLVATYRLMFAYKWYLRFSQPFLTVVASQFVVFLAMLDLLLNWRQLTHWW